MINSLPYYIQNNIIYDVEGNKNRYSCNYSFNFSIGRGCNTNYSYLFQNTDSLYNKLEFKFTLGSASHKL